MILTQLDTIANIKSTPRTDGEVIKASKFIAETATEEFYASKDCIVAIRDDLGDTDLILELIELSANDAIRDVLEVKKGNRTHPVQVVVPSRNPAYVYYIASPAVSSEMILDTLMQKANEMNLSPTDLQGLELFEQQFLGKSCGGNFAMYYHAEKTKADYTYVLQFKSIIYKTIDKLINRI